MAVNEDGATPVAALLDGEDGLLYGVASVGGANGIGTVFSMTPDGTVFTTLHDFEAKNGSQPTATPVLGAHGKLYGTTSAGGTNTAGDTTTFGTIWSISATAPSFTKIYSFDGNAGASPKQRHAATQQLGVRGYDRGRRALRRSAPCSRLSLTGETITAARPRAVRTTATTTAAVARSIPPG